MFATQLKNELLKLFARKRTHIGFGAFLVVQELWSTVIDPLMLKIFDER